MRFVGSDPAEVAATFAAKIENSECENNLEFF